MNDYFLLSATHRIAMLAAKEVVFGGGFAGLKMATDVVFS